MRFPDLGILVQLKSILADGAIDKIDKKDLNKFLALLGFESDGSRVKRVDEKGIERMDMSYKSLQEPLMQWFKEHGYEFPKPDMGYHAQKGYGKQR